jgi:hypothetical protein
MAAQLDKLARGCAVSAAALPSGQLAQTFDDRFVAEIRSDSEERARAAISHVLTEYPCALPSVEQAARGAPPPRQQDLIWLAHLVDEAAQVAQAPSFPRPREAELPTRYTAACQALAACVDLDECRTWTHKAAALASYARQMHDETLRDFAARIQARAARRCGQLLLEIAGAQGMRTDRLQAGTGPKLLTRAAAATAAGLSERQRKDALRIAALPDTDFDAAVEAAPAPTLTALAARGTVSRPCTPAAAAAPTPAQICASAAALFRVFAILYDTDEAVHSACASSGITSAMLRWHVEAVRELARHPPARGEAV